MTTALEQLAANLAERGAELAHHEVVAGFDAAVDEMISVVEQRDDLEHYHAVPTISRFAELMAAAAGRSSLREIVVNEVVAGGCAVNLGLGLIGLGVQLDCFAALGNPIHSAFAELETGARNCISWSDEPGRTIALEFNDGKYMMTAVEQLAGFDADHVASKLADGRFTKACRSASALAFTNWALYPHMSACWDLITRQVLNELEHRPWLYVDLVDPRSRSEADIREMLGILTSFNGPCRAIFGGNLNEANAIGGLLGIEPAGDEPEQVLRLVRELREALQVDEVAIHCIKLAAVAASDGEACAPGPYTPTPKRSTGAGDRFNAGYLAARMLDLEPEQRLLMAGATSGFFVRNARSASVTDLTNFVTSWAAGTLSD